MVEVVSIPTPGLGDMSYLFAHEGEAILVDPQRDIDRFIAEAADRDVQVRWVVETHLHNDYISGGRAAAAASAAQLVLPAGAGAAFEYTPAFHGEDFTSGALTVRPLHTPGHTPEHVSYLVLVDGQPVAVFSGGSLLVGAAGRTDLLGFDRARQLARLQWGSLNRLAALPDDVGLYPTHGAGSFCTANLAGPSTSTIGQERVGNPLLAIEDPEAFADTQLTDLEPYPTYYAQMGPTNLMGPTPIEDRAIPELDADGVREILDEVTVVDGRPKDHFAAGHIPEAWGIEANQDFATWVGWLLPYNTPLVLILDDDQDLEEARLALARVGFEDIRGVMRGMTGWEDGGHPTSSHGTITARQFLELADEGGDLQVLDVRSPNEWKDGHLEASTHRYLPDLVEGIPTGLDPNRPLYVGCTTGHRASTAAGILNRSGHQPVVMVGASLLGVLMLREQRRTAATTA
jgi:hydroxyacylglutathione hydrolase